MHAFFMVFYLLDRLAVRIPDLHRNPARVVDGIHIDTQSLVRHFMMPMVFLLQMKRLLFLGEFSRIR